VNLGPSKEFFSGFGASGMDKGPEVISTAEPFLIKGGLIGCLLLHGYTGAPKEMRLLSESLTQEGITLLVPHLFSHATDPEDMLRAWITDVDDALNLLISCIGREKVFAAAKDFITNVLSTK
jgi:esterase/lipase